MVWPFSLPPKANWDKKDSSARPAELEQTAIIWGGGDASIPRPNTGKEADYIRSLEVCSIAFQCLRRITAAVAEPEWIVSVGGKVDEKHELNNLLRRSNISMSGRKFFETLAGNYFTWGQFATVRTESITNKSILELWPVLASLVEPMINKETGAIKAYKVGPNNTKSKTYPVNPINGDCELLFSTTYNPNNLYYGLSAFPAAWNSIQQYLAYETYNYSQLKNGSDLAGIISGVKDTPMGGKQAQDLLENLKAAKGPEKAGKWLITTAPIDSKAFDRSPKDMDYINGKSGTAREIAQTFGVPALLLGLPGDNTFNNYDAARRAFVEDTIIPHYLVPFGQELGRWASVFYKQDIEINPDLDTISALIESRTLLMTALNGISFISVNEKREWLGYDSVVGGDEVSVSNSQVPISMAGANRSGEDDRLQPDDL